MDSIAEFVESDLRDIVTSFIGPEFFLDTCDLIEIGLKSDGHSADTVKETAIAENVPCLCSKVSGAAGQMIAGGVPYTASHRILFEVTADTMAIQPSWFIKIHARGVNPEMIFEQPVRAKGSIMAVVKCLAKQTVGFRSPANV